MVTKEPVARQAINKKRTFRLLLVAQSLSAFGDNAVYAVIMGILLELVKSRQIDLSSFGVASALYANCLFLPYVIGAPLVGWLSDRYTKKSILVAANLVKACGSLLALAGVFAGKDTLMASYLLVGVGAAVYSPSKYGIIPELKSEAELVKGNAAIEMTTILSILLGIIGGGLLIDHAGALFSFALLSVLYCSAALLNALMENTGICNREEKLAVAWHDFVRTLKGIFTSRILAVTVIGTSVFWSSASFVKLNLQTWGQQVLQLATATSISLLALWLSIGIIIGSFLAGKLFKTGHIRHSWLFGFAMGAVILVMVLGRGSYGIVTVELILLGALGGLFMIPLNAALQARSEMKDMGKVIAIQNFFENGAMLGSAGVFWLMNTLSFSSVATFIAIGGALCTVNLLVLFPLLRQGPPAPLRGVAGEKAAQ